MEARVNKKKKKKRRKKRKKKREKKKKKKKPPKPQKKKKKKKLVANGSGFLNHISCGYAVSNFHLWKKQFTKSKGRSHRVGGLCQLCAWGRPWFWRDDRGV